ncbi:MAG: signal peptidase I [Planctomycetota bacterium]
MIAAILSLIGGPLGQLYAGRGERFFGLALVTHALIPTATLLAVSITSGRWVFNSLMVAALCWPVFLVVDAFRCAKHAQQEGLSWYQRWWIYPLVLVAWLSTASLSSELCKAFIADTFVIPSRSMAPTIAAGDRIFSNRLVSTDEAIEYGNVIVFNSKGPGSPLHVMRVIALGGDTIEIRDEAVFLNGKVIDEPYASFAGDLPTYPDVANMAPIKVPPNHFFVLGDARRRSFDSRFLGTIPTADFRGLAVRVFWSRSRDFTNPRNPQEYRTGPISWDRVGIRVH